MRELSVVIITYNEEENIGRCIDSVAKIANDIVVVDSFSTDRTKEIALSKGARFVEHVFEGHIQQKNWAITQAKYPFILSLDADEELSPTLARSVRAVKESGTREGYTVNRLNYFCGKPIKTCGWYPDRKLRLWNSQKGKWEGTNPHDRFVMHDKQKIKTLKGDLLHYTYPSKEAFMMQIEKFSSISANHLKHKNSLLLYFKLVFSPPLKFVKTYLIRGGFKEGLLGIYICFHQSREVAFKYKKAIALK